MRRPLLIPVLFFLSGIIAANCLTLPVTIILPVLILAIVVLIKTMRRQRIFFATVCLFFFALGAFRCSSSMLPNENDISKAVSRIPEEVLIYGTVTSDSEWKGEHHGKRQTFSFAVERMLKEEELAVTGNILVKLFSKEKRPKIGDKLVIGGEIFLPQGKSNPGGFDYKTHLSHRGIRALFSSSEKDHFLKTGRNKSPVLLVQRALFNLREKADHVFKKYLSHDAKAVVRSVTLGLRGDISDDTGDVFIKTGTMHILAVSGLHTGLVALGFLGILRFLRCPKSLTYILAIVGIWAFALFTGARPSSLRAAVMGSFVLVGLLLGRETDILNALCLSAFFITFFWPAQIFRPGFILSYLAVLSIIFITPVTDAFFGIKPRTRGETKPLAAKRVLLKSLSLSLAVWIGMMPVIAYYFQIVTPSVVFANLIAVPALYVMIVLGFALLIAGSVGFLMPVTVLIAGILNALVPFFIRVMHLAAETPLSFVRVASPGLVLVAAVYLGLAMVLALSRRKEARVLVGILVLFLANFFVWNEFSKKPPDSFRVTFFDIGKADASLLEFPDSSTMLIDGGSGGDGHGVDAGRNVLAPYLRQRGIRRIDCALLTHGHEDHFGGLTHILKNFRVGALIESGHELKEGKDKVIYQKFKNTVINQRINCFKVERGDEIKGFPEISLYVLNPPGRLYEDANEDSIVVKAVTDNGNSLLFCGDAHSKAMKDMVRFNTLLKSDVMKVPHHGMGLGDMDIVGEFMRRADPSFAVIQNKGNSRLNKRLMEVFGEEGASIYVTGDLGVVIIAEEKDTLRAKTYFNE